ncbi:Bgt-202033 [Blumeria graminis f. sp. tritici]|uniref:Bgt-202033 n=1 Tax=Blumeria graminis f. sp. tritici TaxID=62690 RepID=A0A9X9QBN7_BLUGR|nr:Bgt-202033 [Blumeria graminis f. sp. tritici]
MVSRCIFWNPRVFHVDMRPEVWRSSSIQSGARIEPRRRPKATSGTTEENLVIT